MYKRLFAGIIGSGIIGSAAFFLFPNITGDVLGLKIIGALAFATALVQALAIWYFLTSLHAFTRQLKRAYFILVASIIFLGCAQLLLLVSFFLTLDDNVRSSLFVGSYILSAVTGYVAIRTFAGILKVSSWLRAYWKVGLISLVTGGLILLWPHEDWGPSAVLVGISFASVMFSGTVALLTGALVIKIKNVLGKQYARPMTWLMLAFFGLAFANYMETITKVTGLLTDTWYYTLGLNISPEYLAGILFMGAGITLKLLSREHSALPERTSYVDVVTYAANLVSDPAAIDTSLDKMRQITALQHGDKLSESNKAILVDIYLDIENYLTTEEPVRAVSKDQLREKLPQDFQRQLHSHIRAHEA